MSDPQTPGPLPPRQRSGPGCTGGCFIAVLAIAVLVVGGLGYVAWYMTAGFKHDPTLQMLVHVTDGEGVAHVVLGDNIQLESVESSNFQANLGSGKTYAYVVKLKGSKGEGRLSGTVHIEDGRTTIVTLVLSGPDGHSYDLREDGAPPKGN